MSIEIRALADEEVETFVDFFIRAFGDQVHGGEAERVRLLHGLERTVAAFDQGRMVGTAADYPMDLTVPGGTVPCTGLSKVAVAPDHRRRGILRSMMDVHFGAARERGEPVSILWASEVEIYQRFGYGPANELVVYRFDRQTTPVRPPADPDRLDEVEPEAAHAVMPELFEQARRARPGRFGRSADWWEHRRFPDPEWTHEGSGPRRYVVASRDGRPVGYATYRVKTSWDELDLPRGEVRIIEVAAVDNRAEHSLWWFLANIDLFPKIDVWAQPTDSILPWITENFRGLHRRVTDGIHLRILDVTAALEARRYDAPGSLTLAVTDTVVPENGGTYRLEIDGAGTATCARAAAGATPDLRLDVRALSSLYLGAWSPADAAAAGQLEGHDEALATLRRSFAWPVAPLCDEAF